MKKAFSRSGGWSVIIEDNFRSGLEVNIAKQLEAAGVAFRYERDTISYVIPASDHTYYPDFVLPNGIIVEGKGLFDIEDRKKHLLVKQQYPQLDIRFVFSNPNNKLYKGSKTTYASWCDKNGFKYAKKLIPVEWLQEPRRATEGLKPKKVKKGKHT